MTESESYGPGRARPEPMSLGLLKTILRYDPETGQFTWLINSTRMKRGSVAGTTSTRGYVAIKIDGQLYKAHRLAWYFSTEVWPDSALEIDHINENKGDNRIINLRLVTRSENQKNIASRRTWKAKPAPTEKRFGRGVMRSAPMTQEQMRALLSYDTLSGNITWASDCGGKDNKRIKAGTLAGCLNAYGYIVIRVDKVLYPAHRLAWFLESGIWPVQLIDHVNGVRSDNRLENLRLATASQNGVNRRASLPNTSGYRGVVRVRDKWLAQIGIDGYHKNLGTFDTPEAAYDAYSAAVREHHGEFGRVT